jgi:hypothetical protein
MSNKNQTGLIGAISYEQEAMSSFLPLETSAHNNSCRFPQNEEPAKLNRDVALRAV